MMPITVQWDNDEKTIVLTRYEGECTSEEMNDAARTESDLIQSVAHPVGVIIDWRDGQPTMNSPNELGVIRGDFGSITQFGGMLLAPDLPGERQRAAITVMVVDEQFVKAMNDTFSRFGSVLGEMGVGHTRFTADLDDARQIILDYLENSAG